MKIAFTKMQGAGNDYIYVEAFDKEYKDMPKIARILSDRHYSVGGDGVVFLCKSDIADCRMRMFNADGSEGKMCGNASRCIARYLYDNKIVNKTKITLETLSGVKTLDIAIQNGEEKITVNMGEPELSAEKIPVNATNPSNVDVLIDGKNYAFFCVSMGNPHAVTIVEDPDKTDIKSIAEVLQNNSQLFPEGVNVEFVKIISPTEVKMRVYERGSGETLACGTGACATVVALYKQAKIQSENILVHLKGGDLTVSYKGDVYLQGKAEFAFNGVAEI